MASIKSTVFLKATDFTLIQQNCYQKGIDKLVENDLELIIKQIQNNNPRADERNKMQTGNGNWFYKLDENKICYLVLTSQAYPERQAFAMIKEMEKELRKIPDYHIVAIKEMQKKVKSFIKDLQDKYNHQAGGDKIVQAQNQIDSIQNQMEENVKKMLENGGAIDGLDNKAEDMQLKAKQFQNQSTELAKLMYWRNFKLKAIIVIIILAVILYLTIPLIIDATKDDDDDGGSSDKKDEKESTDDKSTDSGTDSGSRATDEDNPPPDEKDNVETEEQVKDGDQNENEEQGP